MENVKLIATKLGKYSTRHLTPGDRFEATPRDARTLIAIGNAKLANPPKAETPPPAPAVAPVPPVVPVPVVESDEKKAAAKKAADAAGKNGKK